MPAVMAWPIASAANIGAGGGGGGAFNADASTGEAPSSAISTFLDGANGFGATWHDHSGDAANAIQATANLQPQWISSTAGGKPGFRFDATSLQRLCTAGNVSLGPSAFTVFAVIKGSAFVEGMLPTFVGINAGGSDSNGPDFVAYFQSPNFEFYFTADDEGFSNGFYAASEDIPDVSDYCIMDFSASDTEALTFLNGAALDLSFNPYGSGEFGSVSLRLTIGGDEVVDPLKPWNGDIVELIVYPTVVAAPLRASVRENIATFYNIAI
jgi:hypothetical protein